MNTFIKREYDYAIRICAYLAGFEHKKPVPLPKVAKVLFITKPFATKIVHKLMNAGITGSVQGKAGGIYLNENPTNLSLFHILKAMHFNSTLNECIEEHHRCPLLKTCKIHEFFIEAEQNLFDKFKNKMISDLIIKDTDISPCLL